MDQVFVLKKLQEVIDQNSGKNIVEAGLVREVEVDEKSIFIHLQAENIKSENLVKIKSDAEAVLKQAGANSVEIQVSQGKSAGTTSESSQSGVIKHVVTVGAGKGGVGKSTVAVNLALALKNQGFKVGIMDGDIYGPNLPLMLGIQDGTKPAVSESNKLIPIEAQGLKVISIGLLVDKSQAMVWRGPMLHSAVQQFLQKVEWGELDFLIVDLPPGTGDVQLSLAQSTSVSGAIVVSTPQEVALEDVRKAVIMFNHLKVPILGMVENMAGDIFGRGGAEEAAKKLNIPFLGRVELHQDIRVAGDNGKPVLISHPESQSAKEFLAISSQIASTFTAEV